MVWRGIVSGDDVERKCKWRWCGEEGKSNQQEIKKGRHDEMRGKEAKMGGLRNRMGLVQLWCGVMMVDSLTINSAGMTCLLRYTSQLITAFDHPTMTILLMMLLSTVVHAVTTIVVVMNKTAVLKLSTRTISWVKIVFMQIVQIIMFSWVEIIHR